MANEARWALLENRFASLSAAASSGDSAISSLSSTPARQASQQASHSVFSAFNAVAAGGDVTMRDVSYNPGQTRTRQRSAVRNTGSSNDVHNACRIWFYGFPRSLSKTILETAIRDILMANMSIADYEACVVRADNGRNLGSATLPNAGLVSSLLAKSKRPGVFWWDPRESADVRLELKPDKSIKHRLIDKSFGAAWDAVESIIEEHNLSYTVGGNARRGELLISSPSDSFSVLHVHASDDGINVEPGADLGLAGFDDHFERIFQAANLAADTFLSSQRRL